ncbi:MAG TPA: hypothetical protein DEA45_04640 [Acholeplasmataceae bacterium]|nr:hypothetical protein [Acholeplasmataceae bacterium]
MIQSVECKSCGNVYYDDSEKCPYCGSVNPLHKKSGATSQPASNPLKTTYQDIVSQNATNNNNTRSEGNKGGQSDINVCLLIALLVIFWPAGLVYLIVKLVNK